MYIVGITLILGMTACSGKQSVKDKESVSSQKQAYTISIYRPEEETGKIVSKQVEIKKLDAKTIWKELQKTGIVREDEEVLGMEIIESDKSIILDLNKNFGERLRSVGITEENEIISSVVNTYLEAFACEQIKVLENGEMLMSNHKEYTNYMKQRK